MLTDKTTKKIDWASILPKDKTETDVNMEKANQINPENILKNANLGYYKDFLIRNQSLKGILKINPLPYQIRVPLHYISNSPRSQIRLKTNLIEPDPSTT